MTQLVQVTIFYVTFSFTFIPCMELNDYREDNFTFPAQKHDDINFFQDQLSQINNANTSEQSSSVGQKELVCPHCDEKFTFNTNRCRHIRKIHRQIALTNLLQKKISHPRKTISCTLCLKKFDEKQDLELHNKRVHTPYEKRPHSCDECGMRFLKQSELAKHANRPHDKVPLPCTFCLYMTQSKSALTQHINDEHFEEIINDLT